MSLNFFYFRFLWKKFIALLLIFPLFISSSFAQINYWLQKVHSQFSIDSIGDPGDVLRAMKIWATWMSQFFFASSSISIETKLFVSIAGALVGSAILYPSMVEYLSRSRDTSRALAIRNIYLALMSYNVDTLSFLEVPQNGCLLKVLEWTYIKKLPTDPLKGQINYGCVDSLRKNSYAYRLINLEENEQNSFYALISTTIKNTSYGNSPYTIDEVVKNPRLIKKIMNRELKWKYYIEIVDWY